MKKILSGIAGIMGGLDSEVSNDTTSIALEAASFQPARVRRGTRLLGLSSEASSRFERGVDLNSTALASDFASYLILKYCANKTPVTLGPLSTTGIELRKPITVSLRPSQIKRLLDINLDKKEIAEMLQPLDLRRTELQIIQTK